VGDDGDVLMMEESVSNESCYMSEGVRRSLCGGNGKRGGGCDCGFCFGYFV